MLTNKSLLYIINADWYFQLHWLDRALAAMQAGAEVHLACHFTDRAVRAALEDCGIICHAIEISRSGTHPLRELQSFRAIRRLAEVIAPDLIHTVTVKPNVYGGAAAAVNPG